MSEVKPIAIDLFAGAGGFGLGFEMAGYDVPLSLEIDAWACDTLRYNHPSMTVLQGDIRDFTTATSVRELFPLKPDIIIGGPPCQGFSIAGPARKDPTDPRNSLFMNFAQWISFLEPSAFIMENVKGLLIRKNTDGEKVIDIIQRTFRELGYFIEVWIVNAANYGVPQTRERIFIVGHHEDVEIAAPKPSHLPEPFEYDYTQPIIFEEQNWKPVVTLEDAISDLPVLEAGCGLEEQPYAMKPLTEFERWARSENCILYNHVAMEHTPRLVERFRHIHWGESISDVPEVHGARLRNGNGILSKKSYDQNNRRLHPYKPSHTIAASFYANFVHPFQHRNLTAREGARIQSFPDSYRFMGKKTVVSRKLLKREERFDENYLCQYNQIGNAVPPLLAKAIALHIRKTLDQRITTVTSPLKIVEVEVNNVFDEAANKTLPPDDEARLPEGREVLIHGSNLSGKENHKTKYKDEESKRYLAEIRTTYNKWHIDNMALIGPGASSSSGDKQIVQSRVALLEAYKDFLDQQHYAEKFDSRSNLHSSVLEEFLYYLAHLTEDWTGGVEYDLKRGWLIG